jgi:hypothetical protein
MKAINLYFIIDLKLDILCETRYLILLTLCIFFHRDWQKSYWVISQLVLNMFDILDLLSSYVYIRMLKFAGNISKRIFAIHYYLLNTNARQYYL